MAFFIVFIIGTTSDIYNTTIMAYKKMPLELLDFYYSYTSLDLTAYAIGVMYAVRLF
jgi:hypothetical protein